MVVEAGVVLVGKDGVLASKSLCIEIGKVKKLKHASLSLQIIEEAE